MGYQANFEMVYCHAQDFSPKMTKILGWAINTMNINIVIRRNQSRYVKLKCEEVCLCASRFKF